MNTITINNITLDTETLIDTASEVMKNAYTPYSKFNVGACVVDDQGTIYAGANIENVSFGLTSCAERNAIFSAASQGARKIIAVCVIANTDDFISPCGACRQVMREFAMPTTKILLCNSKREIKYMTMEEILPFSFGPDYLHNE